MIEIKINTEKLVQLIEEHSVWVSHYGFVGFKMKVINIRTFFEVLHEAADCDKETFIDFVNTSNKPNKTWVEREKYKRNDMIDALFLNIEYQGVFQIAGFEALGTDHYIPHRRIDGIIPINKTL